MVTFRLEAPRKGCSAETFYGICAAAGAVDASQIGRLSSSFGLYLTSGSVELRDSEEVTIYGKEEVRGIQEAA